MKIFFKSISFTLAMIFILTVVSVSAFAAVNVDGIIYTQEWIDAQNTVLYSNTAQSANNISYSDIKSLKTDENTIYLALSATDAVDEYLDDCGAKLTIPGMGSYTFGVDNTSDFENNDNLDIKYATTANLEDVFFFEFKITFKKPISENLQIKIQLKDGADVLSKEVAITVLSDTEVTETTAAKTTTKKAKATTTKKSKTTQKAKTTKYSANKADVTKFSSTKNESVDSNAKKTTSSETSSEFMAKLDTEKSSSSKTVKTILSVFAVLLIIGAAGILVFAKTSDKKQEENKDEKNEKHDSKSDNN